MVVEGTILVVDDTAANLEVVSQVLEDAGYDVATAIDGERALKVTHNHPPDLILLDVQMPEIDGFAVCQQLKSDPTTAEIPIVFMTALGDTESKIKGFDLGAVDYITKPFEEKELLARVKTHVQLWQWNKSLENRVEERTFELKKALDRLQQSQLQLVQSEKMSALGNLVAGVAHEINNPVSFIGCNLQPAREYIRDLFGLIDLYQEKYPNPDRDIEDEIDAIDLEYIREDLLKLIESIAMGADRIGQISRSLRTFSRNDADRTVDFDIHEGLDSTLLILKHRLKANDRRPEIEVVKYYSDVPSVRCFPGQINQVFMNLIANAIDALEEQSRERSFKEILDDPNQIIIQTDVRDEGVVVRITDNGVGMPEDIQKRIFEQGFTTKEVGKGTGLGMAIAYQIVTEKHNGTMVCSSELGKGTTFTLMLPLSG
ncbi:MAG: hybrid sensor histidine kinase/response regulator [Cyanobacteria bacterium SBC]|nr:hybrid sensor histidine kinase/response regulator [Cyanobacteria bacterium SBC]